MGKNIIRIATGQDIARVKNYLRSEKRSGKSQGILFIVRKN